jgi:hypothetical protein
MKKQLAIGLAVVLLLAAMPALASGPVTKPYENRVLSSWQWSNFPDIWDLTQCDLTLSYTINMSEIASAGWSVTEVGLRQVGAPNIDPNLQGGWMQSNYMNAASNPTYQNINDMHLLSKHGWSYQYYDVDGFGNAVAPYWSNNNYGFWFDRDGVDQWQANFWGAVNGGTYSTGGTYDIVIAYQAVDASTGTMLATINGVQQGLYIGGWKNAQPEFYPAGKSFTGNVAQMQVFYGRGGGGGTVTLSDITVTGCPYWTDVTIDVKPGSDPNSINLGSKGVVPVAVLTTDEFDAGSVDPASVVFADASPVRWALEDVDGDGDVDLVLHFRAQELALDASSTEATLTGSTYDGQEIQGTDSVRIVPTSE